MIKFTFISTYNLKALTTMAKVLRKTLRKKRSTRSHIFGWIVIILALLLVFPFGNEEFTLNFNTVITLMACVIMLIVLIFEDKINGYFAMKRMLPGTYKSTTVFDNDKFISTTEIGKTEWQYEKIILIAETAEYFVFVYSTNHAQVYDKNNLEGGTVDDFRKFISNKTGKNIEYIK